MALKPNLAPLPQSPGRLHDQVDQVRRKYRSAGITICLTLVLFWWLSYSQWQPWSSISPARALTRNISANTQTKMQQLKEILKGNNLQSLPGPYPQPSPQQLAAAECRPLGVQYVPSPLEAGQLIDCDQPFCAMQSMAGADEEKELLLVVLEQQVSSPGHLLLPSGSTPAHAGSSSSTLSSQGRSNATGNPHAAELHALSYYHTTYTCTGGRGPSTFTVVSYIEPLYGMLRHPDSWDCRKNWRTKANDDTSYIILAASLDLSSRLPGAPPAAVLQEAGAKLSMPVSSRLRKLSASSKDIRYFLFDLGASTYSDLSQSWMHHAYAARGIHFDRIFMWEAKKLDTRKLFKDVPDEVYQAYQFYHEPATADPASKRNPLNHIRTLTRPEDFVAFKLDIDTPDVEAQFVEQILQDSELYSRIDEFFWEQHYNEPGLIKCCWGKTADLSVDRCTAMRTFLELRKRGIRAHGWP